MTRTMRRCEIDLVAQNLAVQSMSSLSESFRSGPNSRRVTAEVPAIGRSRVCPHYTADPDSSAMEGLGCPDAKLLQALAAASAFITIADKADLIARRDEFVRFIDRQGFVERSRRELKQAFDHAFQRLDGAVNAAAILHEMLRPLAGLSLASIVVRTAERVATVGRNLRRNHIQALITLRAILVKSADQNNLRYDGSLRPQAST